jgi:NADH-quinone oxidoreductase subunit F
MSRDEVIETVKASGLRGGEGPASRTGVKWSFMPKEKKGPHYLCCNADESEPGTFKDRELLRWTPHQVIEGCLIGAYAIQADHVYIYCRGEFFEATQVLARPWRRPTPNNLAGKDILGSGVDIDITIHSGSGGVHLRGGDGPHELPGGAPGPPPGQAPLPGGGGAFGKPTTINNVETLCRRPPHRAERGGVVPAVGHREEPRAPSSSA